jgi:P4 family phage/plasmid primase-like protien
MRRGHDHPPKNGAAGVVTSGSPDHAREPNKDSTASAMLDRALKWAELGVYIFPAAIVVDDGKKLTQPKVAWGTEATTDLPTIRRWWSRWPDAIPCAACKPSKLAVVDFDQKNGKDGVAFADAKGLDFPITWNCETPSGGHHVFYRDEQGLDGGDAYFGERCGIDVKAAQGNCGGMVKLYAEAPDDFWSQVAPCPEWLAGARDKDVRPQRTAAPPEEVARIDAKFSNEGYPLDLRIAKAVEDLERCPSSIQGQDGSSAILVACAVPWKWGIADRAMRERLVDEHFNREPEPGQTTAFAKPVWDGKELEHKHDDAEQARFGEKLSNLAFVERLRQRADGAAKETDLDAIAARFAGKYIRCTDVGNAERFAAAWADEVKYCSSQRRWYTWTGTHWQKDERGRVQARAKLLVRAMHIEAALCADDGARKALSAHAKASESANRISAMLALAQSEPGIAVSIDEFDRDPWLLNCPNGTLNLHTYALRSHNPADLITRITSALFDPDAKSNLLDKVLGDVTAADPEMIDYLQRIAGYSLVGVATEKAFFFAHGPPDSGKSTFVNGLGHSLGSYHVNTAADTWLQRPQVGGNRGDLVRLAGARLVTACEFRKGTRFDHAAIKNVTGGDKITAAAKYEGEIEYTPAFTLLMAGNDLPLIDDLDEACWGRLRPLPFEHSISLANQDDTIRERVKEPECARAFLAWAVAGCKEWQQRPLRVAPKIVAAKGQKLRDDADHVAQFFEDCCEFGSANDHRALNGELWSAYATWCRDHRKMQVDVRSMATKLEARGCVRAKSGSVRLWKGVSMATRFDAKGAVASSVHRAQPSTPAA